MKKLLIGVSSLLMTLTAADAFAQTAAKKAAGAAANSVRTGKAAAQGTRTTIQGARGTSLGTTGAAKAAGAAATGAATTSTSGKSSLQTNGARAQQAGKSTSLDTSLQRGRDAIAAAASGNKPQSQAAGGQCTDAGAGITTCEDGDLSNEQHDVLEAAAAAMAREVKASGFDNVKQAISAGKEAQIKAAGAQVLQAQLGQSAEQSMASIDGLRGKCLKF